MINKTKLIAPKKFDFLLRKALTMRTILRKTDDKVRPALMFCFSTQGQEKTVLFVT